MSTLPTIDLTGTEEPDHAAAVATDLDRACRDHGFFLLAGHGVPPERLAALDQAARATFALPTAAKERIAMRHGGAAWRGWFPEGGELTAGRPDHKEGLYFGEPLGPTDPRVREGLPLHGPNLYPAEVPALRPAVERWLEAMTALGHRLIGLLATALEIDPAVLQQLTAEPTVLFRIFRYPARPAADPGWGVGEHTDYGLLTILATDGRPGLEVRTPDGWQAVAAPPETFVVNLGDMLELMTGGRYRSTPHRVRHRAGEEGPDRLSFPFFFDPGWHADVQPLITGTSTPSDHPRWDGADVASWTGRYGTYLQAKVRQVFPALSEHLA